MRSWNSIGTLATGPIADVAPGGEIGIRDRSLVVEVWVRAGDRWLRPGRESGTRQRRVDGMPVIETRVRSGSGDVVLTTWADEGGDGRGRVLVSIENSGGDPVAVATVIRPRTLLGPGRVESIRVVGRYVVVDGRPLLVLPRDPVDIAVGSAESADLEDVLADDLVGDTAITARDGTATAAVMWPLAAASTTTFSVIDGRARVEAAPTPVDRVLGGWRAHLEVAAEVALPGWPAHLWPALLSGLLLRVEEATPPLGGTSGRGDDVAVATALAVVGLFEAAAIEIDRLLLGMTDGSVPRHDWPLVGVACSRLALHTDASVLRAHPAGVAAACGELLGLPLSPSARAAVVRAVGCAAGERAAADAATGPALRSASDELRSIARLGAEVSPAAWAALADADTDADEAITDLAFRLVLGARGGRSDDVVGAVRAAAASAWSWEHHGVGDSPRARAELAIALRCAAVREVDDGLDLAPGFGDRWLGRNFDVRDLPTTWGTVSYSIRWHGARPALLWALDPLEAQAPVRLTTSAVDPAFAGFELSGEALLAASPAWRHVR